MTSRDLEMVRWLGRVRFATSEQLARRFGLGRSQRFHRVGSLCDVGYLTKHPRLFGQGAPVLLATRAGLSAARADLGPGLIDVRSFAHDLELVELVIENELAGADVTTERELRSLASEPGAQDGRFALALGSVSERRLHFPDLIVEQAAGRVAIELEIAAKTTTRLRELLRGYGRSPHIDAVTYLCPRPSVARRIGRLAKELGLEDLVEVTEYQERSR